MQDFEFLRALAPKMKATEFSAHFVGAFCLWPKGLFEAKLNRTALSSTVQHTLFNGNPDGWEGMSLKSRRR
ncbi:hypothetical protein LMG28614_04175 [Paraburkholderia ultramafica]|uniref:Uncharacterized protein n=1 Tax=Paraburkholderia ultramafica TaxID=1544867 RepID=A0A6S7BE92_9BURK|nr:hypothetical protein LMG28614_04175 [Paraburkholderia ultramafica]